MTNTSPRGWADTLTLTLTSVFGLGYAPIAPGTFGTLGALPLAYAMRDLAAGPFVGLTMALTVFAIFVSHRAESIYGGHDVQHIVIDEVVGFLWTMVATPFHWPQVVMAFVLFRFFDAVKPWPIRAVDRGVPGGLGVVLDDVVAGLCAAGVLAIIALCEKGVWA